MEDNRTLSTDMFRMPNEQTFLFSSLSVVIILLIFIMGIHPLVPIILICFSFVVIKIQQNTLLGNAIKVAEKSYPDIYKASKKAANNLSMVMPDVFVKNDPYLNAYAIGFMGKKSVVLNSELVRAMDFDELLSIIGHEFAHIKCGHTSWIVITSSTNTINIPLISPVLQFIFLFWSRKAEYTADRGGLIASENLQASTTALLKLAGGKDCLGNVDDFLSQQDKIIKDIPELIQTHPYLKNRIKTLLLFWHSDTYKKISDKTFKRTAKEMNFDRKIKQNIEIVKNNIKDEKKISEKINKTMNKIKVFCSKFDNKGPKRKQQSSMDNTIFKKNNNPTEKNTDTRTKRPAQQSPPVKLDEKDNINFFKAALKGDIDIVKMFLKEKKADPNFQDKDGDTVLHQAVSYKEYEIIRILLEYGAATDIENKSGETPISLAQKINDTGIISLFNRYNR